MLLNLIKSGFSTPYVVYVVLSIPVILFSLTFHEYSHAYASYKLGDPTARNMGRLTLNPVKHLDPIGTAMMLLVGFGYAKPVPVNVRNFDKPKKGMALTSAAGPLSNLFLSLVSLIVLLVTDALTDIPLLYPDTALQLGWFVALLSNADALVFSEKLLVLAGMFLYLFHYLNLTLAVFNPIPIPPLDGSRLANIFLPDRIYFGIMKYERFIMIALLIAIYVLPYSPVAWVVERLSSALQALFKLIPGL